MGTPDPDLLNLIATSRAWYADLKEGRIASTSDIVKSSGLDKSDVSRRLCLAFLAPSIL